jgi:hypothetical protein
VSALPSLTLQIFALHAIVEGMSLGALDHRARTFAAAPSAGVDAAVRADEERHVRFAWGYMRDLVELDGPLAPAAFDEVARQLLGIFATHARPERVAERIRLHHGRIVSPEDLADTPGGRQLRRSCTRAVLAQRTAFVDRYRHAGLGHAGLGVGGSMTPKES